MNTETFEKLKTLPEKERLEHFKHCIFNNNTFDFENPYTCLVAQMVKSVYTHLQMKGNVWSEDNIIKTAKFYGVNPETLISLESESLYWREEFDVRIGNPDAAFIVLDKFIAG